MITVKLDGLNDLIDFLNLVKDADDWVPADDGAWTNTPIKE